MSVISIEIMMIAAVMITGADKPALARDTMYSVLMIVLNGMIGASLLLGALRYREQQYNLQGANAFLAVIVPLAIVGLILPNYTLASAGPTFSRAQALSLVVMTVGIYAVFLSIQTVRHRSHFTEPVDTSFNNGFPRAHHDIKLSPRSVPYHGILLLCYLVPLVLLSKKLALPIDHGITVLGAPPALGGFMVAVLVLSPEGLGAIHAALANQLQRAVNIFLGSALATISLTIPAVLVIGLVTGEPVALGLEPEEAVMLITTLMVSIITFGSGRTNVLLGAVHLLLFFTYFMLIFD
jgi:Ca2+:H+ antiporter